MSYVKVPGLSGLKDAANAFKSRVNPLDVVIGAVAGFVGGKVLEAYLVKKNLDDVKAGKTPAAADSAMGYATQYATSLGSLATGLALFAAQKGNDRSKGHLVGSAISAVVAPVGTKISAEVNKALKFGDYVTLPYGQLRNDFGQLVADPSAFGALYNDSLGALYNDSLGGYESLPGSLGDLAATSAMTNETDEYNVY